MGLWDIIGLVKGLFVDTRPLLDPMLTLCGQFTDLLGTMNILLHYNFMIYLLSVSLQISGIDPDKRFDGYQSKFIQVIENLVEFYYINDDRWHFIKATNLQTLTNNICQFHKGYYS